MNTKKSHTFIGKKNTVKGSKKTINSLVPNFKIKDSSGALKTVNQAIL